MKKILNITLHFQENNFNRDNFIFGLSLFLLVSIVCIIDLKSLILIPLLLFSLFFEMLDKIKTNPKVIRIFTIIHIILMLITATLFLIN